MAISRNMMERQLRAGGGIMTLEEPRQGYFLGKIVRKAKRAVKKVVKSPLGKIALLGGLGAYAGGLGPFAGLKGAGFAKGLGSGVASLFGTGGKLSTVGNLFKVGGLESGAVSIPRVLAGLGIGSAIAAPFLMGGDEEEVDPGVEVSGIQPMVAGIRDQAKQFYRSPAEAAASGLFFMPQRRFVQDSFLAADGGLADIPREGYAEGGIMDLGGMEKDYREGGFVPIGAEERADDVPARLSKNEFVFTADAVRNAGGGDIDKGAKVMQNMMDNLEAGGMISEESQGKENPAQAMFDQAQMLENRIV
jgi:hypothetical protein